MKNPSDEIKIILSALVIIKISIMFADTKSLVLQFF